MAKKNQIGIAACGAGLGLVLIVSFAFAQTATPLSVSCSGVASSSMITWTASTAGGTAPYQYAWSGAVAGTSSMVSATYSATGTFQAALQVGDAATSTATSTCLATVTSLPVTSTSTPTSTPGTPPPPPASTSTTGVTHVNPGLRPRLEIGPLGRVNLRGTLVTVASTTFTVKSWGGVWTVITNASTSFRRAHERRANLSDFLPGDFLAINGQATTTALTIDARMIKNFSLRLTPVLERERERKEKIKKIMERFDDRIEKRIEEREKQINKIEKRFETKLKKELEDRSKKIEKELKKIQSRDD